MFDVLCFSYWISYFDTVVCSGKFFEVFGSVLINQGVNFSKGIIRTATDSICEEGTLMFALPYGKVKSFL